jgi:hypothetical protein
VLSCIVSTATVGHVSWGLVEIERICRKRNVGREVLSLGLLMDKLIRAIGVGSGRWVPEVDFIVVELCHGEAPTQPVFGLSNLLECYSYEMGSIDRERKGNDVLD